MESERTLSSTVNKLVALSCGTDRRTFQCTTCQKTYKQNCSLWRHKKFECGKAPSFSCSVCEYMCYQKSSLHNHMKRKH
ncbi:hypothetical protein D910_06826 [Dendroctonus ponderosae]|uniref:C2H2-type domain-containing protein n=1 Tax=Dendroctonus ponderosae TaxID=77166 RepID=U4U6F4_DENPD|nr:hypothetical protein D910_06826 [Dendroctonus ponderosae]KAH1008506.1 hypothetical protein HUJ05_009056 [Dendroctonus ponderosae]